MALGLAGDHAGHGGTRRRRSRRSGSGGMKHARWFLPETPDVLGLLRRQLAVTIAGVDAFAAWAAATPPRRRSASRAPADDGQARNSSRAARRVHHAARARGPVRPLARNRLDPQPRQGPRRASPRSWRRPPDGAIAEMAAPLAEAVPRPRHRHRAARDRTASGATEAADAAIKAERALERPTTARRWPHCWRVDDLRERDRAPRALPALLADRRARRRRRRARDLRGRSRRAEIYSIVIALIALIALIVLSVGALAVLTVL